VAGTVINQIKEQPILVVFYALGYATGNVVGIKVEGKLAFGLIILRVISRTAGDQIAVTLRGFGQPVTKFEGEGMKGPVVERDHMVLFWMRLPLSDDDCVVNKVLCHDVSLPVSAAYGVDSISGAMMTAS
jgi:hypothetical protein